MDGKLDHDKLKRTIGTAMRMLDNVIDINYYAVNKARNSNFKHRPVGLGIMGFQDCLHMLRIPYASQEAVEFADRSMEAVATTPTGPRPSSPKSAAAMRPTRARCGTRHPAARHARAAGATSAAATWKSTSRRRSTGTRCASASEQFGMRNSNCIAIAPTATISNIIGVSPCIEPTFQNLYVKSNLSGEFTVVNEYLVGDLKKLGLWDEVMVSDLKYFDGSLAKIDRVPAEIRRLYATAFEIEPQWLVEAAARRQKWIDQAQSLNIYMAGARARSSTRPTSWRGCAA